MSAVGRSLLTVEEDPVGNGGGACQQWGGAC